MTDCEMAGRMRRAFGERWREDLARIFKIDVEELDQSLASSIPPTPEFLTDLVDLVETDREKELAHMRRVNEGLGSLSKQAQDRRLMLR